MKAIDFLKLIPSVLVSAGIVAFWYDDFMALWMVVALIWITLPVLLAAIVIFFLSLKRKTVGQRVIVAYGVFNVLLLAAYLLIGAPKQRCNPEIMERHYEKHAAELDDLCRYAVDALDDSCGVTLEWEHGKLNKFHVTVAGRRDNCWSEEAVAKKDSLMAVVGLTAEEFDGICERVKKAGCIGIEVSRSKPHTVEVWFRREGFGRYDFIIKDSAFSDAERADIMEDMVLLPYNERVAFQYGGGAVGPQTFSREAREEYMEKHKAW
ncbi:MAG: hypothetical protein J6X62_01240 [Bacteroidales bacterium]|nr:hypothetical protein [Bacteroidales bacterium]